MNIFDRLPQSLPTNGASVPDGMENLSEEERACIEEFGNRIGTISIPAKTLLLEEGKVADILYLIKKGCLRLFFLDDGRDITFQFFFEGDFVASFDSMHRHLPSRFSLESIEATEAVAIGRNDLYGLLRNVPSLRLLYEEKLTDRFRTYQQLFLSRIRDTPRQRYEELLRERPDIVRRVPQHYIASYLGITPVSLSRIRNRR
ncbi:Crp/Fnr family transcriptional regulator [Gallalistipes aquisgranensis]|uniref:Crp/Fnr family transcriptional regulator n=1 Tax=Gallalistipes aquisgranensis TaxID=2779358 RepID=UPI001CF824C7|nr:Crp/Fnr family transcriptional regulator [Gallalistipes aquisgranensis]